MCTRHKLSLALPVRILLFSALVIGPLSVSQALTLDEYFAEALQRSETTAIKLEQVHQAEEQYQQAGDALLPTINGVASTTWQDPTSASSSTLSGLSRQNQSRISLSQPLFRGMREYAALRQNRDLLTAQKLDYRHAQRMLYIDVLQNFYTILALESDIKNYQREIQLNQQRQADLRNRVRIGRSRESALLTVQSTISTLRATIQQLRGQLQVARTALNFLSGLDATVTLTDTAKLPSELLPLRRYLNGVQKRADVQAAKQRFVAATEGMKIARGEHWPSVDLNANYYLERPGYLNESKWDVELALTIPIYSGGTISSRVREAGSVRNQAELTQTLVVRQARQEIRSLYQSVYQDLTQLQALRNATKAARKNYEAQLHDYQLDLVSNLDVIQALTSYQQNQRTLDRARLTSRSDYLQLLASSEQLPILNKKP